MDVRLKARGQNRRGTGALDGLTVAKLCGHDSIL